MGRMVEVNIQDLVLTSDASQDVFSLIAVTPNRIRFHAWELTSEDLAAVLLNLTFQRITAVGSGGIAAPDTPELVDEADSPRTSTVRLRDTTPGAAGGKFRSYHWEQLGPVGHVYTPRMRPIAKIGEGFSLLCNTAVVATLSGYIAYEEVS